MIINSTLCLRISNSLENTFQIDIRASLSKKKKEQSAFFSGTFVYEITKKIFHTPKTIEL